MKKIRIPDMECINCGKFTGFSDVMGCCAIYPLCYMGGGNLDCEGMPTGCNCLKNKYEENDRKNNT